MSITQLNFEDIKRIGVSVGETSLNLDEFMDEFGGNVEFQQINKEYTKAVISPESGDIKTIVIVSLKDKLTAVTFYGTLNINSGELFNFYKTYREAFSIRDNLYFYFFNEEMNLGNYTLSFFQETKYDLTKKEGSKQLGNIFITLP